MDLKFITNEQLFREVIQPIASAKTFVWIGTADIKDMPSSAVIKLKPGDAVIVDGQAGIVIVDKSGRVVVVNQNGQVLCIIGPSGVILE